ncbi:OmpA family protein [Phaeovulum sp.]|uniref:OmpA family protein n=2 Tax=Phaeovulum sp. TaxID=2934796 RepID=UPI002730AF04|nr:OmpA family protein [Phaeovulum sp.]MDP1667619.1 OmpA family protein [Phaeovulum sp.]MDP2063826.1 OmpA family protein [Phaeovulum sp.]MDZ4118490.1 OmpA family protein [Phaeovulum sp.]
MSYPKPLAAIAAAALALGACTNVDGTQNQAGTGAIIGGLTGAAAGQIIGGNTQGTIIGGAIGAGIGAAIGNQLDNQERELRQSLAGTSAGIVNTGSALIVSLPEAITFDFGSAVVHQNFRASLASVSRSLQNHPNTSIRVVGHTDNVGTLAINQQLSEQRALAVAQILVNTGTPSARVRYLGRAFYEPIASNASAAGRAANRRVEIIITPNR